MTKTKDLLQALPATNGLYVLQVAGCRLQVAGCRLKFNSNSPYTRQGLLHKVVGVFRRVS